MLEVSGVDAVAVKARGQVVMLCCDLWLWDARLSGVAHVAQFVYAVREMLHQDVLGDLWGTGNPVKSCGSVMVAVGFNGLLPTAFLEELHRFGCEL